MTSTRQIGIQFQGRIQEFYWGGRGFFFSKSWGLGAALRPPVGPGQRPGGGSGAKFALIGEVTPCPLTRNAPFSTHYHQKIISSLIYLFIIKLIWVHLFVFLGFEPPLNTHSYSHYVLRPLSQQIFLVFFHENIVAN